MDKAAIFTELTRRNALRREAKLPLLDLQAEFQWECAAAARRDYDAQCAEHEPERERIIRAVVDEWVTRFNNPPNSIAWHYLRQVVLKRFNDYMRSIGVTPVPFAPSRNPILYGKGK